ncbi:unnamed protein product [Lepeophtheirus salmonis]|uniref:(salmon louse) hypothetical protein n=1 Tax=Lepeophtheirus salmonis TaxID=72036 RepID=A0A7R8CWC6_LEPSM|nr:unnamed protein product [Lepeophtheirus salmonis]CAF2919594.1 unnamed protein product [Lepeophtheirus salmonis]
MFLGVPGHIIYCVKVWMCKGKILDADKVKEIVEANTLKSLRSDAKDIGDTRSTLQDTNFWAHTFKMQTPWSMHFTACRIHHPNVDALKNSVNKNWSNIYEKYIKKYYLASRKRLKATIAVVGRYIELKVVLCVNLTNI